MEDEDFKNIEIRRFLQYYPQTTQYLEIDAEFAEDFVNLDDVDMLNRIVASKKKKKFMMHVLILNNKLCSY